MTPGKFKRPILVVDDEPNMLLSLRDLLRRDFEVNTAQSGAEGIAILEQKPIHVVMTDQRMPQMTGVEFLTRVKDDHPGAIRMIFTGYADLSALIDAINEGNVFRYVAKPWDPDDLIAALQEAGRQYDLIVERKRLLADLRTYESQCMAFDEGLRGGLHGTLTPAGTVEAETIAANGRSLRKRLDVALAYVQRTPVG